MSKTYDHRDLIPRNQFARTMKRHPDNITRWRHRRHILMIKISSKCVYVVNMKPVDKYDPPWLEGWPIGGVATELAVTTETIRNWSKIWGFETFTQHGRNRYVDKKTFTEFITRLVDEAMKESNWHELSE